VSGHSRGYLNPNCCDLPFSRHNPEICGKTWDSVYVNRSDFGRCSADNITNTYRRYVMFVSRKPVPNPYQVISVSAIMDIKQVRLRYFITLIRTITTYPSRRSDHWKEWGGSMSKLLSFMEKHHGLNSTRRRLAHPGCALGANGSASSTA
jgi:hypothetical protein